MSKKSVARRLSALRAMRQTSHRYDARRAAGMVVTLGVLLAVPLTGLARVDAWRGAHRVLGEPAPFKHALAGVILAIGAFYVVTFLVNLTGGRLFCGWGCPVGQLSRFGESVELAKSGADSWRATLEGAAFSAALVLAVMAWWVDLRVLWLGTPGAALAAWSVLVLSTAAAFAHGRLWRWHFCQSTCPIGLYYSLVSPARWFGVYFRNQADTCLDCDLCDRVCPVDLRPRDLLAPSGPRPGLALGDAPGRNHCLECGDCVRACEWIVDKRGEPPVPLLLGFFGGPQRSDGTTDSADA